MRGIAPLSVLALVACVPRFDADPSRVDEERILAVRAEPSEVLPGGTVTLTVLDADGRGTIPDASLSFGECIARLPLSEPGPVARACLDAADGAIGATATGATATLTLSADACRLFGPDPPPAQPGEPSGRPVDPDPTGGYVQPVRIALEDGRVTFAFVRLACGVSGATRDQAAEVRRRYRASAHPVLDTLVAVHEDGSFQDVAAGVAVHVAPSEALTLRAGWPLCPEVDACGDGICGPDEERSSCREDCATPIGCRGAERYVRFDRGAGAVVVQRESIRVSWLATAGRYDELRTGRAADDATPSTENVWHAPDTPGTATLWLVLRDDREGVSWAEVPIVID
ncbi:MAG: hypothetical protein U0234_22045 [Sandaracinus sp.]